MGCRRVQLLVLGAEAIRAIVQLQCQHNVCTLQFVSAGSEFTWYNTLLRINNYKYQGTQPCDRTLERLSKEGGTIKIVGKELEDSKESVDNREYRPRSMERKP